MAFLTVSDASGEMEAVVFPNVYKRFQPLLRQGSFVLLEGKIEERDGNQQFIVQLVTDLEAWLKIKLEKQPTLYLKITMDVQDEKLLLNINQLLKENRGGTGVILHYEATHKTIKLGAENNVNPTPDVLKQLRILLGSKNVVLKD
jgi:DNA polymerase-3 subunit alpha